MPKYTIDEYYDSTFYNEALSTLKNNKIDYTEYVSVKDYLVYLETETFPIMVDYDKLSKNSEKYLITKVKPLKDNEEYLYQRRNETSKQLIIKLFENEPLKEARTSDYGCFFTLKNKEQVIALTKLYPKKIYYFGKYYSKYRVFLTMDKMIKNFISTDQILLEKTNNEPGRFEADLNFLVFKNKDKLVKYTETPYFLDGKFNDVSIRDKRIYGL